MAIRPVYISKPDSKEFMEVVEVDFTWFSGFSIIQKQKSIESFHQKIKLRYPELRVLEISSKSKEELGILLSAFNLMIKTKKDMQFSVETAFQASKVFENGGPFLDLYNKTSLEAKKDNRIKNSGELLYFQYFNRRWELEPKTSFYDWLYINALSLNEGLSKKIVEYDAFTDIEFNPKKSINCQAKAAALYVSLFKAGLLESALSSAEEFKKIVYQNQFEKKNAKQNSKPLNKIDSKDNLHQLDFFNIKD